MITKKTQLIATFSLVYLAVSILVLGSTVYKTSSMGEKLKGQVDAVAEKNKNIHFYSELSRRIEETKEERNLLSTFVLTEENTSSFLTEIEDLGRSRGVSITTNSLQVVPKEGIFNELSIRFSLEGREDLVKDVVMVFETLPYHSRITSLVITEENSGTVKGTVDMVVTLLKHE